MKFYTTLIFLFSACLSFAQAPITTTDWDTEEDFRKVEGHVIQNIKWLETTPFAKELRERQFFAAYCYKWLTQCPYIDFNIPLKFSEPVRKEKGFRYPDLVSTMFYYGKGLYHIENQEDPDEIAAIRRGIVSMITIYNEIKKTDPETHSEVLEDYIKLEKRGKLEKYISEEL